jgi:hypothetical protein
MNYHVWRQRFIAKVQSQQRLIFDKGKALSTAIDKRKPLMGDRIRVLNYDSKTYAFLITEVRRLYREAKQKIMATALDLLKGSKVQLSSLESVRAFREKLEAYKTTLNSYHIQEEEFSPNGPLYRAIIDKKFTQPDIRRYRDKHRRKGWPGSVEGISKWLDYHQSILEYSRQRLKTSTTFPKDKLCAHKQMKYSYPMTTINVCMGFKKIVMYVGNKGAGNQVKSHNYVLHDHEDITLDVIHHTLGNGRKTRRRLEKNGDCECKCRTMLE